MLLYLESKNATRWYFAMQFFLILNDVLSHQIPPPSQILQKMNALVMKIRMMLNTNAKWAKR